MKQFTLGVAATLFTFAAAAAVETEMANGAPRPLVPPAPAASAPVVRPGMFAAASAPFVKRLTPEQRDEWRFLKEASASARFEHDASQLALAKSQDANVRSLAAALINHNAASLQSLQRMLHARNMAPPMLANDQRRALTRMGKLQGAKFDREWMEWVAVRSQQDSLQSFEKAATTAHDPQLRGWIDRTLPAMRYQFATAERMVNGGRKYASLSPHIVLKAPAVPNTRAMGAPAMTNTADLSEGNMVLGPANHVAVKVSPPYIR